MCCAASCLSGAVASPGPSRVVPWLGGGARHCPRLLGHVEQRLRQHHTGQSVQHSVVHLCAVGPLAAEWAVDDEQAPQRTAAVQQV